MDNMQLLIGLLLIGGACGLIIYAVGSQLNEKSVVRQSLRQLDGYEVENVRDQELLVPIGDRTLKPVMGGLTKLGRRFTPVGYTDNVRKKMISAGNGSVDAVDRFLAIKTMMAALDHPVVLLLDRLQPAQLLGHDVVDRLPHLRRGAAVRPRRHR